MDVDGDRRLSPNYASAGTAQSCWDPRAHHSARQPPRHLLLTEDDDRFYRDHLPKLAPKFGCAVHAYVLMTNHVDLLLTPERGDSAALTMKHLVQLPIEKGRKNWTGGSGFVITPARDLNQEGAMQGCKTAIHIEMDDQTRATLVGWLRRQKTPVGLAKRARAMLLLAEGHSFAAPARQVELRERHVRKWALRFVAYDIRCYLRRRR